MAKKKKKPSAKEALKARKKARRRLRNARESGAGVTRDKDTGKPSTSARGAVKARRERVKSARENLRAANRDVRRADYEGATDRQRARIDDARENWLEDRVVQARQVLQQAPNSEARQRALRIVERWENVQRRQGMNPAEGGSGWNWRWDRDPATTKDNPTGAVTPDADEEDFSATRSVVDWALRRAFPDEATRTRLVDYIVGFVQRKELTFDSDTFVDQAWDLLAETEEYKQRFPGLVERATKSPTGRSDMSPQDYLLFEDQVSLALQTYGVPSDAFNFNTVVSQLVANDVTVDELYSRVALAAQAATYDEAFLNKFTEFTGMDPGYLVAFYLDPDMTNEAIVQEEQRIRIGAMMSRYGLAGSAQSAAQIQGYTSSIESSATDIVARAASMRGLQRGYGQTVSEADLVNYGTQADESVVRRAAAGRVGRFNRQAGAAETREGVVGLRGSQTT